jgi:predicted alpha/beta-hydrolase family hydrolase
VKATAVKPVTIEVNATTRVSGLIQRPANAVACFVFAHGAGAGMQHPFMVEMADGLAALGVATLRYQFPYMERKSKRPDPPTLCQETVRAAVVFAARRMKRVPLIAGGKSFGGRMTSQAQALEPLRAARGLAFLGFPLHPPKRPSAERATHLASVNVPMLFMQGTRDELAQLVLLKRVIRRLRGRATLKLLDGADHSFHVLVRSGRTDAQVMAEMLKFFSQWINKQARRR